MTARDSGTKSGKEGKARWMLSGHHPKRLLQRQQGRSFSARGGGRFGRPLVTLAKVSRLADSGKGLAHKPIDDTLAAKGTS